MMHAIQCVMMWCDRCSCVRRRSISLLYSDMSWASGFSSTMFSPSLPASEIETALQRAYCVGGGTDHAVYCSA
jgi:hypothetical protein